MSQVKDDSTLDTAKLTAQHASLAAQYAGVALQLRNLTLQERELAGAIRIVTAQLEQLQNNNKEQDSVA